MTSYRGAGVDLDGAERHVSSIAGTVTRTWAGHDIIGGFGGFAAGTAIPSDITDPVIMMTTDGVGTKIELARALGSWDGIGQDLVAMCLDDLAVTNSRPIGFVDYLAVGKLNPSRDEAIVDSIAAACTAGDCPLLGGETAEHPGVMDEDAVDLAGTAIGVVARAEVPARERVSAGDVVIGLASPNLRSNGFSLIRALIANGELNLTPDLLEPSVLYSPVVAQAFATGAVKSAAHVTGGGLATNLSRSLPTGLGVELDPTTWTRPVIFDRVMNAGVAEREMWATFNMGIGFCLITAKQAVDEVLGRCEPHRPAIIGVVEPGDGAVIA